MVIAAASQVGDLARLEATVLRPPAQRLYREPDLLKVHLHGPLEVVHPPLTPPVEVRWSEPAEPKQDVDRAHVALLRQRRFGRIDDATLELLTPLFLHSVA